MFWIVLAHWTIALTMCQGRKIKENLKSIQGAEQGVADRVTESMRAAACASQGQRWCCAAVLWCCAAVLLPTAAKIRRVRD